VIPCAVPPLDPTPGEARQWLEDELAKVIYHRPPSLLDRIWQWLSDLFANSQVPGQLPPWQALGWGLAIAAVVTLIAWRVAGSPQRRGAARRPGPVLGSEQRSAAELRAAAREQAAAGDWRRACLLAFQALARRLEDAVILDRQAGRTAHELAADAARRLPGLATSLEQAAEQFDSIAYGRARGDERAYQFLVRLDQQAEAAKPLLTPADTATAGVS
jgi:hypothetical protein